MEGCHSLGTGYRNGLAGSIVEVARIEGKIFKTMTEAEAHGLELAKQWVNKMFGSLVAGLLVLTSVPFVRRGRTNIADDVDPVFDGGLHIAPSAVRSRTRAASIPCRVSEGHHRMYLREASCREAP